jgi:hypothetical protein
MEGVLHDI